MSSILDPTSSSKASPSSEFLSPIKGMKRTFDQITETEKEDVPNDAGTDSNVPRVTSKRRKIDKGTEEEVKLTATLDVSKWSFDPTRKRTCKYSK